jgi:CRISPR-associated endoribonuclease Cas6
LGKARFQLARVLATPQGHPWAGKQSWEELAASPPRREASFVFKSPTFFATSKPQNRIRYTPLPEPRLILQSLLDKWQEASPSPFPAPEAQILRELFAWEAELAGFRHLRFQRFQAGKASFPGFVGEVRLKLWGGNENLEQALGRLHALAFFSGVGAKTPYGAGFTLPQ